MVIFLNNLPEFKIHFLVNSSLLGKEKKIFLQDLLDKLQLKNIHLSTDIFKMFQQTARRALYSIVRRYSYESNEK
jgi:hypothetical protein